VISSTAIKRYQALKLAFLSMTSLAPLAGAPVSPPACSRQAMMAARRSKASGMPGSLSGSTSEKASVSAAVGFVRFLARRSALHATPHRDATPHYGTIQEFFPGHGGRRHAGDQVSPTYRSLDAAVMRWFDAKIGQYDAKMRHHAPRYVRSPLCDSM